MYSIGYQAESETLTDFTKQLINALLVSK